MSEFTINTQTYRACRMSAMTQLHVVRRLTPLLGPLAGLQGLDVERDEAAILEALGGAVATLKDEDVEYVLNACLEATEAKVSGGGWAKVRRGGQTMYELTLPAMLQIAYHVLTHNLSGFFGELPSLQGFAGLMSTSPT